MILERESAELIAKRGTFEEIPALARKYGCMSPCPFDNFDSDATKKLFGEIGENIPGAKEFISESKFSPIQFGPSVNVVPTLTPQELEQMRKSGLSGVFKYVPQQSGKDVLWIIKDREGKNIGGLREIYKKILQGNDPIIMTYQITVNPTRTGQGYGTSIFSEWAVNKESLAKQIKRDIIFEDDTSVFQTARSTLNVANARGYPIEIITVIKGKPYIVRSIAELEKLPENYQNYKYFIRITFSGAP